MFVLRKFNEDPIDPWNTSSVTNMYDWEAVVLNQPISQWQINWQLVAKSSVTNMYGMLWKASAFKQTIPEEWKNKGDLWGLTPEKQRTADNCGCFVFLFFLVG